MWPSRVFASDRSRRTVLALLALAGALLIGGTVFLPRVVPGVTDPRAIRAFVRGFGVLAPLAFVTIQTLQVVIAPIPGQVLGFVSGYLFGAFWGTVYSLLGAVVGSYVAVRLSRHFGRPFVERTIHPETLERFDELSVEHGLAVFFVLFLVPGLPDDAICFVAGLTEIEIRKLIAIVVVGRFPGYALVNIAGAQVAADRLATAVLVLSVLLAVSVIGYLNRDALIDRLLGQ
jgi:uncharacterized membrane protein YdjX (TVP38/TMEM64 family)